ncbi:MAG: hypothetical protein LBQ79_05580 [Deltaproteobacteria bacterium]|jgi:hypothetical protein|nr:hypothetical protein [Deltaproteobacteria bacterium]
MTIESVHFIVGRVTEIDMSVAGERKLAELEVLGAACPGGPYVHRIRLLNSERAGERLLSGIEVSDTVLVEVENLRFIRGLSGGDPGHFFSYLVPGGILEKAARPASHSLHFIRATFTGSATVPEGGTEMQFRERFSGTHDGCDYAFRLKGRRLKHVLEAKFMRGEEILVRTSEVRPLGRDVNGSAELTGTGMEFFRIGIEAVRPTVSRRLGGRDRSVRVPAETAVAGDMAARAVPELPESDAAPAPVTPPDQSESEASCGELPCLKSGGGGMGPEAWSV